FWYGYHPEKEVLRVPVVIFGRSLKGIDDRELETEDLIRTVTDYLSARPGTDRSAVSLLGSGSRPFVASLTLKSDRHKEWFLVLYKNDSKYIVNIHPQSSGRIS